MKIINLGIKVLTLIQKKNSPTNPINISQEKIVMITNHHSRGHNTTTNILILDSLRELNDY